MNSIEMNSIDLPRHRRLRAALAALTALLWTSPSDAAQGLIDQVSGHAEAAGGRIVMRFVCPAQYRMHWPEQPSRTLRIALEATALCAAANTASLLARQTIHVQDGQTIGLTLVGYDGAGAGGPELVLEFDRAWMFNVLPVASAPGLQVVLSQPAQREVGTVRQPETSRKDARYVVHLQSTRGAPAIDEFPSDELPQDALVYVTEVQIKATPWHRMRVGFFHTEAQAREALARLHVRYPRAWVARAPLDEVLQAHRQSGRLGASATLAARAAPAAPAIGGATAFDRSQPPRTQRSDDEKLRALMEQARQAMAGGDLRRAVAIYTKVLGFSDHLFSADAQEFLALARERGGQLAHAKAEYERYLQQYPQGEGAARVRQRLAALRAGQRAAPGAVGALAAANPQDGSPWRLNSNFSQYYRRDNLTVGDAADRTTQSSLISNVDVRARRDGATVALDSRLAASYWYDFLDEDQGPGSQTRIAYAYLNAHLRERGLGLRLGRQSRRTGGVLGRFDGLHASYAVSDRVGLNLSAGHPVYTTREGFDDARLFYGVSVELDDVADAWDVGAFYIEQHNEGVQERQAVGGEVRYVDDTRHFAAVVDYDLGFGELGTLYALGNWRLPAKLSLNASLDRRRSPFLTTTAALVGQAATSIEALALEFSPQEIEQLALDRTAISTSYSVGLSRPLGSKFQVTADLQGTQISETIASGGVPGTPAYDSLYFNTQLMAYSMFKEGDMSILGLRLSDTSSRRTTSLTLDFRYPFGGFRANPRIRIDRRETLADATVEWVYSPRLRLQYRWRDRYHFELEVGGLFAERRLPEFNDETKAYFLNLGYRYVF